MRYERKYRIVGLDKYGLESLILAHPAAFVPAFPERRINNLYLDTPNWDFAKDNVDGLASRMKIRVRWYGENTETITNPVLEIKSRSNLLGDKILIPIPDCQWPDLRTASDEHLKLRYPDQIFQPALVNAYLRSYYASMDGKFRITVDGDMAYGPCLPWRFSTPYEDTGFVVELKYEVGEAAVADEIARFLGLRMTKHSKYIRGISLVYQLSTI